MAKYQNGDRYSSAKVRLAKFCVDLVCIYPTFWVIKLWGLMGTVLLTSNYFAFTAISQAEELGWCIGRTQRLHVLNQAQVLTLLVQG